MNIEIGQHLASTMPAIAAAAVAIVATIIAGIAYIASRAESIGLAIAEVIDAVRGRQNG